METRRHFWVFDRTIFDQIRMPEFTLLEGVLIVLGLSALALYFALIVFIDLRARLKERRIRGQAKLKVWLERADLSPEELEGLDRLAGDATPLAHYDLLSSPERFERRVHKEIVAGRGSGFQFTEKLRAGVGYHSGNLLIPVISTRQFRREDSIRLILRREGNPMQFYGTVREVGLNQFSVQARKEAVKMAQETRDNVELFLLRGLGTECRFSCRPLHTAGRGLLVLAHALMSHRESPRSARLPLTLRVTFRERGSPGDAVAELDPETAPSEPQPGWLQDLSEGGFSIAHGRRIHEGRYIQFALRLPRKGRELALTGRVLQCRSLSDGEWLSRCELRGQSPAERDLLQQVVGLAQRNRLRGMAFVGRRTARPAAGEGRG